jgi:hypothetical protein
LFFTRQIDPATLTFRSPLMPCPRGGAERRQSGLFEAYERGPLIGGQP